MGSALDAPTYYRHAAGAETRVLKASPGTLQRVVIGTKGAAAAAPSCTVYDNTAGSGSVISILDSSVSQGTYEYGLDFYTGLAIVCGANSGDMTFVFE
jgi:hypothetical protein